MNLKKYSNILQIISVFLCLAIIYILFWFAPNFSLKILNEYPQFEPFYYPWLIMFCLEGLPIVFCGLICMKLYENIGDSKIFTRENLKLVGIINTVVIGLILLILLANILSVYFWIVYDVGFIILHIVYLLILIIIHFVLKIIIKIVENGVELKEDSDLTV